MPDTSSYSGLPVPLLSEAANLPAALTDFRDDLEPHIVLFATSVSDMTSSYGAAPLGTVVSIPSIPAMYQKVASGWRVTSEDTGWQTIADANFEADWDNISSAWRRVNGYTMVDIRATFTGVTVNAPDTGGIPDIPILTLPSGVNPVHQQIPGTFLASSPGVFVAYVSGSVEITHLYPNGSLNNLTNLTASLIFARG